MLVRDGEYLLERMHRERVPADEIVSEMRKAGIEGIDRVRWAVLEPDGKLSFIASDNRQRPPKEDEAAAL